MDWNGAAPGGCGGPDWEWVAIQGGQERLIEKVTFEQRTKGEGRGP